MAIDTKLITELRDLTGAGIGDCRAALEESNNDIQKAIEVLRKKGSLKAAKKAERATKEGVISLLIEGDRVGVVGLACETDFVARNEDFINEVQEMNKKLIDAGQEEFASWADEKIKKDLIIKVGENLQLAFAEITKGDVLGAYLHTDKKSAAVVVLSGGDAELGKELAMQVVAMAPKYLKPADVPIEEVEKEKEIYREQLLNEGKPAEMIEKIIPGKLEKFYSEVCLLNQPFIKDDKRKIADLVKQAGEGAEILTFKLYRI